MSVQSQSDQGPLLRIGELSRRTGVRAETLRAWERRYGLLEPQRTEGGFRLYGARDEARVRAMKSLISSGVSAAQAAEEARNAEEAAPPRDGAGGDDLAARLLTSLGRFDDATADSILDESVASLSVPAFVATVALPVMHEVGERWSRGQITVAQEHFASNIVRGRLLGLGRGWGGGGGPVALLACPPGERHDIGLIGFGLVLRANGWRISYLGVDTPVDTLADAAETLGPAKVVVAALDRKRISAAAKSLAALAAEHDLSLGGAGADARLADKIGARLLEDGPVEAAAVIAASGRPQT